MKFALVNPAWDFRGSIYFGCQEPHYPLELLFAFDQIGDAGHEPLLIDAQSDQLSLQQVKKRLAEFDPNFLVIPTAPSYLFWRCPPPELRVPQTWFRELGSKAVKVAIGPHSSATPSATLRKLNCDVALRGEPERRGLGGERGARRVAHVARGEQRLEDHVPDVVVPQRAVRVRGHEDVAVTG